MNKLLDKLSNVADLTAVLVAVQSKQTSIILIGIIVLCSAHVVYQMGSYFVARRTTVRPVVEQSRYESNVTTFVKEAIDNYAAKH